MRETQGIRSENTDMREECFRAIVVTVSDIVVVAQPRYFPQRIGAIPAAQRSAAQRRTAQRSAAAAQRSAAQCSAAQRSGRAVQRGGSAAQRVKCSK